MQHDPPPDIGLSGKQIDALPVFVFQPVLGAGSVQEAGDVAAAAAQPPARRATSVDVVRRRREGSGAGSSGRYDASEVEDVEALMAPHGRSFRTGLSVVVGSLDSAAPSSIVPSSSFVQRSATASSVSGLPRATSSAALRSRGSAARLGALASPGAGQQTRASRTPRPESRQGEAASTQIRSGGTPRAGGLGPWSDAVMPEPPGHSHAASVSGGSPEQAWPSVSGASPAPQVLIGFQERARQGASDSAQHGALASSRPESALSRCLGTASSFSASIKQLKPPAHNAEDRCGSAQRPNSAMHWFSGRYSCDDDDVAVPLLDPHDGSVAPSPFEGVGDLAGISPEARWSSERSSAHACAAHDRAAADPDALRSGHRDSDMRGAPDLRAAGSAQRCRQPTSSGGSPAVLASKGREGQQSEAEYRWQGGATQHFCVVCLDEYNAGDAVKVLPCGHRCASHSWRCFSVLGVASTWHTGCNDLTIAR
jgi:hypothetical protein